MKNIKPIGNKVLKDMHASIGIIKIIDRQFILCL